ncbi:histo-blood group ABO system transferase-like isoform X3 [Bufo gargarizans]|uniref:histo-blood group ABO system transferase-like isoform X3 n=1 Tax=Bufo gargarizans TaxID=30331 RepID=UPI001CF37E45|nr:histo-blood group ABO system transferase-like isoform X3 [Bufo gargarizans]
MNLAREPRGHMDIWDWRTITITSCKQNGENKSLISSHRQKPMIDRMLYKRPQSLNPPRTDVLSVTPWLAPIVWNRLYNIDILNAQFHKRRVRIGLTVFAIRKYTKYIEHFLDTAEKFFMTGHRVTYYVMTDQPAAIPNITLGEKRNLVVLEVPAYKRWQDITMRRMQIIRDYIHDRFVNEVDYLVCLDVDMEFRQEVGVEILSDVYGVMHSCYFTASRKEFTNERRPQSAGYIPEDEGDFYYTGSHFGGTVEEIYKLTNHCHHAMLSDKAINIEALWHDESYLNRYFLYYKPTKVLSPEYSWTYVCGDPAVVEKKRFIVLPKEYDKVRDNP